MLLFEKQLYNAMYSQNLPSETCQIKKDFLLCLPVSTLAQFYQISIVHYKILDASYLNTIKTILWLYGFSWTKLILVSMNHVLENGLVSQVQVPSADDRPTSIPGAPEHLKMIMLFKQKTAWNLERETSPATWPEADK